MKNLGRYNEDLSVPRKQDVDGKYTKPVAGIPKSDLNDAVQSSLGRADSALQEAPVTSVNGKTGAVRLGAADVSALPSTTEIPSKTSDLVNNSGFITEEDVPTKVSELVNDSGFITEAALNPYAKKTEIPTKTSELTNDSGFIKSSEAPVQSVDGKTGAVTTEAVKYTTQSLSNAQKQQARANIGAGTSSFSGAYSDLTGQPSIPSATSDLENDSGFITDADVPVKSVNGKTGAVKLAAADVGALPNTTKIPTKTSDITNDSGYITASDVPTKTSDLTNDSGFITASGAPVQSVNGQTGAVNLGKSNVGLGNVDNVRQYSASNPPPYPVTSVNGKTGAVTVESGTKVTQYTGTLLASGWAADSYGYQAQTITISGLKASYDVDPEWDVVLSGTDPEADAALLEGFALIHNYKTGANSLTAQCIGAAPTVNIPVKVVTFG